MTVAKSLDAIAKSLEESGKRDERYYRAQLFAIMGIPGMGTDWRGSLAAFAGVVKERQSVVAALQKQALAFGATRESLLRVGKVTTGAKEFGPQIALTTAVEALNTGTMGLSDQTFNLGMEMKAVGNDSRQLFTVLRDANVLGGLTVDSTTRLTAGLKEARDKYGISTDALVNAMGDLASQFGDFQVLGQTEEIFKTQQDLIKKFGAGSEKLINDALKIITSGGRLTFFQRFGASEERSRFASGPSADALMSITNKIGPAFKDIVDRFQGGIIDEYEALRLAEERYGAEGKVFFQLSELSKKSFPKVGKNLLDGADKIKNQIDIQKDIAKSLVDDLSAWANGISATAYQFIFAAALLLNAANIQFAASTAAAGGAGLKSIMGPMLGLGLGVAAMTILPDTINKAADIQDKSTQKLIDISSKIAGGIITLVALQKMTGAGSLLHGAGKIVGGLFTGLIAMLPPLVVPILAILAAAGIGYLIYSAFADKEEKKDRTVKIIEPEGGNVQTNRYMVASNEITKSLLFGAFKNRQDEAHLNYLKQQVAALQGIQANTKPRTPFPAMQSPPVGLALPQRKNP
jgi:hypothetical protein